MHSNDKLIERDAELACLARLCAGLSASGGGRCLLLQGEAGVGKTTLLRYAARHAGDGLRWLAGACEPLVAAPPLGPLLDLLDQLPPSLGAAVRSGHQTAEVLAGMLELLRGSRPPSVLVVDDAQWADGATLDLLRFVGRRIESTHGLLVIAYRDDELAADHPLRLVLGGLPTRSTVRLALRPLSRQAVEDWARREGHSPQGVFERTLGNPFFVGELLACPGEALPASVRDAVLMRGTRLSAGARDLLELASVAPGQIGVDVVDALLEGVDLAFDECAGAGLLLREGPTLRFRHELARQAVASSLAPARLRSWHAALFDALSLRGAAPAHLVHHAAQAGLDAAVIALAPRSADDAATASAHRQAVVLYELALERAAMLGAVQHAAILAAHADECMLINQVDKAWHSRRQALALHRTLDDRRGQGLDLQALARIEWFRGAPEAGRPHAQAAIDVLATVDAPRERAMAFATMAQLHLLGDTSQPAFDWGLKALDAFELSGDAQGLTYALNTVGAAELRAADSPEGWARLERSLAIALAHGFDEHAARAYTNLVAMRLIHRRFDGLDELCADAVAYFEGRDLDMYRSRLRIRQAFGHMLRGRWVDADRLLREVRATPMLGPVERDQSGQLAALLGLRCGDPAVQTYWDAALTTGTTPGLDPWFCPQPVALAEAAWLRGDEAAVARIGLAAWPSALRSGERWRIGELACWLRRVGRLTADVEVDVAAPCALELAGDLAGAAAAWAALGCPYAQALCLLGGGEAELRQALELLDGLGAVSAARVARRRLRALGTRDVQRGPNSRTRVDPLGLTARERQMLELIGEGLSNRAIAQRLCRSHRTVENHVAALLAKLGVDSRHEAAALVLQPGGPRRNK